MSERIRMERQWPRELTLRLGGLVAALALGLASISLGPVVMGIVGLAVGVWALVDGLNGR